MDLSPPTQDRMGFWAFPTSMWNDWQEIQGLDLEIWMYTTSSPSCACCAEIGWHHGEYNAAMQCLLSHSHSVIKYVIWYGIPEIYTVFTSV